MQKVKEIHKGGIYLGTSLVARAITVKGSGLFATSHELSKDLLPGADILIYTAEDGRVIAQAKFVKFKKDIPSEEFQRLYGRNYDPKWKHGIQIEDYQELERPFEPIRKIRRVIYEVKGEFDILRKQGKMK